jgi:hypothetical protein
MATACARPDFAGIRKDGFGFRTSPADRTPNADLRGSKRSVVSRGLVCPKERCLAREDVFFPHFAKTTWIVFFSHPERPFIFVAADIAAAAPFPRWGCKSTYPWLIKSS